MIWQIQRRRRLKFPWRQPEGRLRTFNRNINTDQTTRVRKRKAQDHTLSNRNLKVPRSKEKPDAGKKNCTQGCPEDMCSKKMTEDKLEAKPEDETSTTTYSCSSQFQICHRPKNPAKP